MPYNNKNTIMIPDWWMDWSVVGRKKERLWLNAVEMARDAIELKCVSMEDDGMEIPLPSEIGSLDANSGTFAEDGTTVISLVDIDSGEYRRKIDTKAVRKNVTIPSWLNYEAEHAGINISRVLQEALMNVLNVQRNF